MLSTLLLSFALVLAADATDGQLGTFSCSRWEVSRIDVQSNFGSSNIYSITFTYRDGTSVQYGQQGEPYVSSFYRGDEILYEPFVLEEGEVIVSVTAINRLFDLEYRRDPLTCLAGIEFLTNRGRYSPSYGNRGSSKVAMNEFERIQGTEDDPIVALSFGNNCPGFSGAPGGLLSSVTILSEVPGGGTCLRRISALDNSPEQDGRYVHGRQFKICGVYRHTNRCLHVGHDPSDVIVQLEPQSWEEAKEWPGSLWEFHRPTPGGPWQIRSVLHANHYLHVGGWYEDVRVWQHGGSDWTITPQGTDSGGATRWVFSPERGNDHRGSYLHVGLWWWYTLVWGLDEGSYWYIENPKS